MTANYVILRDAYAEHFKLAIATLIDSKTYMIRRL